MRSRTMTNSVQNIYLNFVSLVTGPAGNGRHRCAMYLFNTKKHVMQLFAFRDYDNSQDNFNISLTSTTT